MLPVLTGQNPAYGRLIHFEYFRKEADRRSEAVSVFYDADFFRRQFRAMLFFAARAVVRSVLYAVSGIFLVSRPRKVRKAVIARIAVFMPNDR